MSGRATAIVRLTVGLIVGLGLAVLGGYTGLQTDGFMEHHPRLLFIWIGFFTGFQLLTLVSVLTDKAVAGGHLRQWLNIGSWAELRLISAPLAVFFLFYGIADVLFHGGRSEPAHHAVAPLCHLVVLLALGIAGSVVTVFVIALPAAFVVKFVGSCKKLISLRRHKVEVSPSKVEEPPQLHDQQGD